MKFGWVFLVVLSALCFPGTEAARAQTLFTLAVVSKGTFKFDPAYPTGPHAKLLFNFHATRTRPRTGETINYFVFKPSEDVFKAMKKMPKDSLFSRIEPCAFGIDKELSDRAQMIGGELRPIRGRTDLLPYLKRKELIESDGFVYVPIDANLRNYVSSGTEYGEEWVPKAVQEKQLCLYIGVGRMGGPAFTSQPVNISRLANFVFVD